MQELLSDVQFTRAEHTAALQSPLSNTFALYPITSKICNLPYGAHSNSALAQLHQFSEKHYFSY